MATDCVELMLDADAAAELTRLGKRLEILRIERGLSKQRLARHAGTSRQQLWRVMTGKSELTNSLRERLASALAVDSGAIVAPVESASTTSGSHSTAACALSPGFPSTSMTVADYLTNPQHLESTLRTLPADDSGRRLKRALLNALEDLAVETERALPIDFSEIHRRVLAGEL